MPLWYCSQILILTVLSIRKLPKWFLMTRRIILMNTSRLHCWPSKAESDESGSIHMKYNFNYLDNITVLRGMFEGLSAALAVRDNLYMDSHRDDWSTIYIKKSQPHIFKAFPFSSSSTMLSCTSWCFCHLISMSKESFFWNYRIIFYPSCLNISYILSLSM